MKKRKALFLLPVAALILSGCTFQEGLEMVKNWPVQNIYEPVKGWVEGLFGKKEQQKEDSKKEEQSDPAPDIAGDDDPQEVVAVDVGSVESPISVSEFFALCDENLKFDDVAEGASTVDYAHIAYVKAKVDSNTWNSEGTKIQYLNLSDPTDSTKKLTGMFVILDSSIAGDYSAKDSLKGYEVVVRGYPALFNKKGSGKTYELVSNGKSDTQNPRLMKVIEPQGTEGIDYGTLESPLTVSQAKAVIDQENPTAIKMYVTGEVKSNEAWSTQYNNIMRITISDGSADLVIFKCASFPADIVKENITANSLKGKTVVANGIGELFQGTTYELTAPQIFSITGEGTQPVDIDNYGTLQAPLTISEAKAVIDLEDPTKQNLYVTGKVKSNTAWTTGTNNSGQAYANMDIVLTDGTNEFTLYRAETLPAEFDNAKPTANQLVGKIIVAHGIGTYYSPLYELKQGCVVDSVSDPAPTLVESVSFGQIADPIEMELGKASGQYQLDATVLPEDATDKSLTWSSGNPNVATVENGLVTAVGEGTTTITATANDGSGKSATANVHVTEPETPVTLSSIEINVTGTIKTSYLVGEDYSAEGLTVMAHYSDQSEAQVANPEWSFEIEGQSVTKAAAEHDGKVLVVTASYENETDTFEITLTVTVQKGTEDYPYTGAEAAAIAAGLANKTPTADSYYIKGTVIAFNETFNSSYGNYSFTIDGGFVGWRLKNGASGAKFSDGDIEYGDVVTMYVAIQNYDGTPESSGGYVSSVEKGEIKSVTIAGTPEDSEYAVGATYNRKGLTASALAKSGVSFDVTNLATWTFSKNTAEVGDTEITVKATFAGVESDPFVINVTVSQDAPPAPTFYDATMAKGDTNSYDDVTINGNAAIKMGKSNYGGNMTITVPAGSVALKFYAVAWNGKGGSNFPVTITGATVSPGSFDPIANSSVSGSGKAFTLDNVDQYLVEVTLSNITQSTTLTLTSTERVIVWGAQYGIVE